MKRLFPFILIVISLMSCTTSISSSRGIGSFRIDVQCIQGTQNKLVTVSGNNTDSGLWIREYSIKYYDDIAQLHIYKTLKNTGNSGPYFIQFIISPDVNFVKIGNEVIWRSEET